MKSLTALKLLTSSLLIAPSLAFAGDDNFYETCRKDPSAFDRSYHAKVYQATCTLKFVMPEDKYGNPSNDYSKEIQLRSDRDTCDEALHGVNIRYFGTDMAEREMVILRLSNSIPDKGVTETAATLTEYMGGSKTFTQLSYQNQKSQLEVRVLDCKVKLIRK